MAIERLVQLRDCLSESANDLSDFAEQTEQLMTAVDSSHAEAVRFRLFGLRRQFASHSGSLPTRAIALLEEARVALQEAGFRT